MSLHRKLLHTVITELVSQIYTGTRKINPDNKVHGANMGPIWGRQDPGGPHIGPLSFAICEPFEWSGHCIPEEYVSTVDADALALYMAWASAATELTA